MAIANAGKLSGSFKKPHDLRIKNQKKILSKPMPTLSKPVIEISNGISDYPEIQLLLYCARTQVDVSTTNHIKTLLEQDIDWNQLVQLALKHRVTPLLYQTLSTIGSNPVPENVLSYLKYQFQVTARHNLFRTNELIRLTRLIEAQKLLVIPFKGPTLAAIAYGNLGLRMFGDLDLLVHQRDLTKIKDLLITQGYQLGIELDWECQLIHPKTSIEIDLHWTITPKRFRFELNIEQLSTRLQPFTLAGVSLLQPGSEDLLLILCIGWCKDYYGGSSRLAQLCDVAELLRKYPQMNWMQVLQRSHQLGVERMVLFTLALTRNLLGADLPELVLNRLQDDSDVTKLVTQIGSWLGCQPELEEPFWSSLSSVNHRLYFAMRERPVDRAIYLFYCIIAPTEQEFAMLALPKVLSFLYYPLRLIRLGYKYCMGWQQRLSN